MSPLYDFFCDNCNKTIEQVYHIEACPKSIECTCGRQARKIITIGGIQTDRNVPWLPSVIDQLKPDYDTRPVETRTEFKHYLKDNGLVWIG